MRFGLAVALASEDQPHAQEAFELVPTASGLVPVRFEDTSTMLHFNYRTVGEGLSWVTHAIKESPSASAPWPEGALAGVDSGRQPQTSAVYFQRCAQVKDEQAQTVRFNAYKGGGSSLSAACLSFTSSPLSRLAGSNDSELSDSSMMVVVRVPAEEFWNSDELLALRYRWQTPDTYAFQTDHADVNGDVAAYAELVERLDELAADGEALYAWMRRCYQRHLQLTARTLSEALYSIGGTFDDGSYRRRVYRFSTTGDFEEASGRRFDELFALGGYRVSPGEGILDERGEPCAFSVQGMPFWGMLDGEPDEGAVEAARPLAEPPFAIADVTQESDG